MLLRYCVRGEEPDLLEPDKSTGPIFTFIRQGDSCRARDDVAVRMRATP